MKFVAPEAPQLDEVFLEIGGKERRLTFHMPSVITAERETGVNLMAVAVGDVSGPGTRAMLYAALLEHEPKVSLEKVTGWITTANMITIVMAVRAAWFGVPDEPAPVAEVEAQTEADA